MASTLAALALGCSGDFELGAVEATLEPAVDDAPLEFDPRDYAAKDVPPPSRAAAWSWPAPDEFRAWFDKRAEDPRSLGVVVGQRVYVNDVVDQRIYVNDDGVETLGKRRCALSVAVPTGGSPSILMSDELDFPLRGGGPFPRLEEVLDGDPSQPGRLRFGSVYYPQTFDVEYALPPRKLHNEDFRDWVYARTLVESGLELAAANAESTRELDTADGDRTAAHTREAELGVDCYESGLIGCYFAGYVQLILDGQSEIPPRPLPRPAVEPEVLARGPVDLTRFFIGYLLDEMEVSAPAIRRYSWKVSMPRSVALAAFDSGHASALIDELFRRARDRERDTWTRAHMFSALTALIDLERGTRPRNPYDSVWEASDECALAVLAEPFWTMDQAYERCVVHPRRMSEALAFQILSSRIPWLLREAYVEPPSADALAMLR